MRWKLRRVMWRLRRARRVVRIIILLVIAAGAIASPPPSAWREVEETIRWHDNPLKYLTRWVERLSAEWNDKVEDTFGIAEEPEDKVRIVRPRAALSGRAKVLDGDTLEVGGVRIRLHGIDVPESSQSCRAGGRRWSCGREATLALTRRGPGRVVWRDASRKPLPLDLAPTRARLAGHGSRLSLRYSS